MMFSVMGNKECITTGKAAGKVGVHPNTLRWYEEAGYLPPVPRSAGGYRQYSPGLVQLARIVKLSQPLLRLDGPIRKDTFTILSACRDREHEKAVDLTRLLIEQLEREHSLAIDALSILERWRSGTPVQKMLKMVFIGEAAMRTGLSRDRVINWERNGLCSFLRAPDSGYRIFGEEELERLKVIRYCRTAGYSLTAIRRLMAKIDEGIEAGREVLETVADSPEKDECDLFPTFPTDTLPATLKELTALARTLIQEIKLLQKLRTQKTELNPPI